MLKQGEKVTRKENWQDRSKSAIVQGRFGSQQISAALWSTHTGPVVTGVWWKVHRYRLCLSETPFPIYKAGSVVLADCEAQFTAV